MSTTVAWPRIVYSVAEAFAALPYERQAEMCRIVGTDLGKMQERPLGGDEDPTYFDVVTASGYYGFTRPCWSVILRAYPATWPEDGLTWTLDVIQGTPGDSRPVYGLGDPQMARDLSAALVEASVTLRRLQEICA